MKIEDIKREIEQRAGVPASLLTGETVEESDFNTMLNRYVKLGSWHLV